MIKTSATIANQPLASCTPCLDATRSLLVFLAILYLHNDLLPQRGLKEDALCGEYEWARTNPQCTALFVYRIATILLGRSTRFSAILSEQGPSPSEKT
jgi:hypothetical protein